MRPPYPIITPVIRLADRFVLVNELGSGGMARVFLGRDEVLDRPVAIKLLNPMHGGTDIGHRFEREGRTAARLAHPNIVQVYDAGEGEFDGKETSYIVMEYIPGGDLKGLIDERGRLPGAELARLGDEICAGLAHAHERGVIHRDIKPHNILLDENGHAKVSDFGIARALDATQATRTGAYLGTALYSSPEQLQGLKATPKSDTYSLGATLYQAATGKPPFSGGTPLEVASQHVSKDPVPCRERGADVSKDLDALILACLAKNPDERPTAQEMRSRLEAEIPFAGATQEQPTAPVAVPTGTEQAEEAPAAPPPGDRMGGAVRRDRKQRRGGLLAVLALLAVLVVIGALAAPGLFGGSGDAGFDNAAKNAGGKNNAQGGSNGGGSDEQAGGDQGSRGTAGGQQDVTSPSSASASSQAPSGGPAEDQEQGKFTAQAAERTVQEFYTTTSEGEYDRAAPLLSESWRQRWFPNRATFEGTFDKVESVEFVEGPNAEVSGNTATVTGETQARLTGEIQHNEGTWYLVQQDGRWKINSWDVIQLSSRPA
jgi:eukaryotic-like serine/threonine-protein kinase